MDARQDGGAGHARAARHPPARAGAAAAGAHRPRARRARAASSSGCSACRWCFSSQAELSRRGARADRRRAPGRAGRPAARAAAPARARRRRRRTPRCSRRSRGCGASTRDLAIRAQPRGRTACRCRARLEPLAQSVLAEARPQRAQARAPDAGRGRARQLGRDARRSRSPTTACTRPAAPDRHGPAPGRARGAAAGGDRGVRRARAGNAGGSDWRCPLTTPDVNPAGSSHGRHRRAAPARAGRRRPRRRPLGLPAHARRAAVGRALRERAQLARRRSRWPARYEPHVALVDLFVGEESGAEICERLRAISPQTNVLLISGAGRISPNAARAAGAAGLRLQGLAGRRHRRRRAHGRARA